MRRLGPIAAIPVLLALASAPGASAATEVGSNCLATIPAENLTLVAVTPATASTLPVVVPSAGVITRWRILVPGIPATPQTMKVLRPTGVANEFENVGESAQTILAGSNVFDVRIPVRAGDHLGLHGSGSPIGTLACSPAAGGVIKATKPPLPLGSKGVFGEEAKEVQLPLVALVEPDADGDGFGDESQDKCPRSATLQTECPVALVDSVPLVKKGAVVLLVATTTTTTVTASGTVKLSGARKKARISARFVTLPAVTKTAEAAKITRIRLSFPAKLKSALAALPPGKSLTLKLKASVTDATGAIASDSSSLKLKRQ